MNSVKPKNKKQVKKVPSNKRSSSPLFLLLVGLPFCFFLISAMLGSVIKIDRVSSESAFENRLNPIEKAWRGLKLKVYAYEYGSDYRNKIPENEGRALGLIRESILESTLPRYLFLFLAIAVPFYFFVRLFKDKPQKKALWPVAITADPKVRKTSTLPPKKIIKN
ncbi:hypothetical protein [Leptospira andrefontaineae]|uniref:Uncharacterized protein n=1 Tax=Leptospira andrefontaineae TaxID=2484976 RepID=A0A4R9H8S7_9LEPT|nr:hypothetical protein [Leptospira andrefontaineae]TGK42286.1 hypothetical protein EHO65_05870 [Leptospira andrefontaineae]